VLPERGADGMTGRYQMKCVPVVNEVDTDIVEIAVQNLRGDSTFGRLKRHDAHTFEFTVLFARVARRAAQIC